MLLDFKPLNERAFWYILNLRAEKLVALTLVGASVGAATVIFMTIVRNRVLTPSIIGFDSLFMLFQTGLLFVFGASAYSAIPGTVSFIIETLMLVGGASLLFGLVLRRFGNDVQLVLLAGVVFGLLFRSLVLFLQRMIDPTEFAVVQDSYFATFAAINDTAMVLAGITFLLAAIATFRVLPKLDVMALGRSAATTLGENYDRWQFIFLVIVAVFIAVSTALVGPIAFLGLIVASLAHGIANTHRHIILVPMAAGFGALTLVLGQAVFDRVLDVPLNLAIIIEFAGGALFLALVLMRKMR